MTAPLMVVAIGGNALVRDKQHQTVPDQMAALEETSHHLTKLVADGWRLAIGHGNGPQVGFILRRSELAAHELHEVPLDVCGADSQGAIGYELQQALGHDFTRLELDKEAVTVVTQVVVDKADPAFQNPTKPIGSFLDEETAAKRVAEGWTVVEDAGRGKRCVVASPKPMRIVELNAVKTLTAAGFIVITVGGGGIPVAVGADGLLHGTPAVIDKDFASSLLASEMGADLFVIATAVDRVALNFGKPDQRFVDRMTLSEAKAYLAEGTHFAKGSMAPKIEACIWYLERGGKKAIITDPPNLLRAVRGEAGTHIVPD